MIAIYKITSPSGKVYIGQTCRPKKRITQYRNLQCKGQPGIYRSLLKYGWNQHVFEVIHELPSDCEQSVVNNYEILYYELYLTCGASMLNMMGPGIGGKMSEQAKEKIRQKAIGRKHKPDTLIKISNISRGKKFSDDHRIKLSKANKGKGGRLSFSGKQHSEATKIKMKNAQTGKVFSESHRFNISNAQKGLRNKQVYQYSLDKKLVKIWGSVKEAGDSLNISKGNISNCALGKIKTFKKHFWSYKLWQ